MYNIPYLHTFTGGVNNVMLFKCCEKRCTAKFTLMEIEEIQGKLAAMTAQEQRQFMLSSFGTSCGIEVSWSEAKYAILVSEYGHTKRNMYVRTYL